MEQVVNNQKKYRKTLIACYLGFITQSIAANFAPLLFVTFMDKYHISFETIALIPLVFYFTQIITDFIATRVVDKIGYRPCIIFSQILSAVGLASLTFLPDIIPIPIIGIIISVLLYSIGSGIVEVLVSPIVEACPFERKEGVMSLLHSFYCWGGVAVILGSTLFFKVFGIKYWKILTLIWAIIPLINTFNFIKCPIEKLTEDGKAMSTRNLLKTPIFWLMFMLMICSGSTEATMTQWASAFAETALGVDKTIGDLVGPCLFMITMGISRALYGKFSDKLNLKVTMLISASLCVGCFLLTSLSNLPVLGLIGCAASGLTIGIMWPGSLSASSKSIPTGGTAMFGFLALAGDIGGTISPALVGTVTDSLGGDLKIGILFSTIFPALLVISLIIFITTRKKPQQS